MAVLTVLVTLHDLRAWIAAGMLSTTMLPFATGALVCGGASWIIPKKWYLWLDNRMYEAFMSACLFIFETVNDTKLHLYGDIDLLKEKQETAVVISNHQSGADWLITNIIAARCQQQHAFRFIIKDIIQYVPLYGWYTIQRGYVYVKRFGQFAPKSAQNQLNFLKNIGEPFWLTIFPEGTRFNKHKSGQIEAAKKFCEERNLHQLKHLLPPRPGGFKLAIDELRDHLDCVYDVTIAYGLTREPGRADDAPSMFEFFAGNSQKHNELHLHIKRIPTNEIPTNEEEIKLWLHNRFVEKDRLLEHFYATGRLPEVKESPAKLLSIIRTTTSFAVLNGAFWAMFLFPKLRKAYGCALALSPLLIIWPKIRKFSP